MCGATLLLLGCGPASAGVSTASPTPSAAATLATAFFTVTAPPGWRDVRITATITRQLQLPGSPLLLLETPPPPPVVRGVNDVTADIVISQLQQPLAAAQIAPYLESVAAAGATGISTPMSLMVSGASGTAVTYTHSIQGTSGMSEDILIDEGGATYEVVLNTSSYAFTRHLAALQSVFATWRWMAGD